MDFFALRKTFVETGLFYAVAYCDYPNIIFHRIREVSVFLFQVNTFYFHEIIENKMRPLQRAKSLDFNYYETYVQKITIANLLKWYFITA